MAIAGAYYPNYFVHVEINDELASKELSGFNPRTTVMVYPLIIIILSWLEVFWFEKTIKTHVGLGCSYGIATSCVILVWIL